jgi:DNA (cytosine-5)-methyltransferase 1
MSSPRAYYNEIDPYAAEWLRNLISDGHIAHGDVDERSIADVQPKDLLDYDQCHFFAGIGGWSLAARIAGWPDDRAMWTGSCPCQPFSQAGRKLGTTDARHLWPEFFRLIQQRCPPVVFGEQVASPAGLSWFDQVSSDLEREGYAIGAADIATAGLGSPVQGHRIFFVASSGLGGCRWDEESYKRAEARFPASRRRDAFRRGADALAALEYVVGHDGSMRLIEPGLQPLAHGVSGGVGRLRAYGNAIVPQVAAEVIASLMDSLDDRSAA